MTYRGVRHAPLDTVARLEKGELVDPAAYYFRIAPFFETASAEYVWINNVVAMESANAAPMVRSTASSKCCETAAAVGSAL